MDGIGKELWNLSKSPKNIPLEIWELIRIVFPLVKEMKGIVYGGFLRDIIGGFIPSDLDIKFYGSTSEDRTKKINDFIAQLKKVVDVIKVENIDNNYADSSYKITINLETLIVKNSPWMEDLLADSWVKVESEYSKTKVKSEDSKSTQFVIDLHAAQYDQYHNDFDVNLLECGQHGLKVYSLYTSLYDDKGPILYYTLDSIVKLIHEKKCHPAICSTKTCHRFNMICPYCKEKGCCSRHHMFPDLHRQEDCVKCTKQKCHCLMQEYRLEKMKQKGWTILPLKKE